MSVRVPALVVIMLWAGAPKGGRDRHPIVPDPAIQARIDQAVQAAQVGTAPKLSRVERVMHIENALGDLSRELPEKLIQQLLYSHNQARARDERASMGALGLVYYFRFPETSIVRAVLPYIDTDNKLLRSEVRRLLRNVEGGRSVMVAEPDYSYYGGLIGADKEHPPAQLVAYMYQRSPGTALLCLSSIYVPTTDPPERYREVLWAEHVVSDVLWKHKYGFLDKSEVPAEAAAELEKLSKHEAWWARLYVAEILRQHPQFRTPALIDRLKADAHELVRRAIQEAEQPRGQKKTSESKAEDTPP